MTLGIAREGLAEPLRDADPRPRRARARHLRRADHARPRAPRADGHRRDAQRVRPPDPVLRGRPRLPGPRRQPGARGVHPRAVDRRARRRRRDPRRRSTATASPRARATITVVAFHPELSRRAPAARAVPRARARARRRVAVGSRPHGREDDSTFREICERLLAAGPAIELKHAFSSPGLRFERQDLRDARPRRARGQAAAGRCEELASDGGAALPDRPARDARVVAIGPSARSSGTRSPTRRWSTRGSAAGRVQASRLARRLSLDRVAAGLRACGRRCSATTASARS